MCLGVYLEDFWWNFFSERYPWIGVYSMGTLLDFVVFSHGLSQGCGLAPMCPNSQWPLTLRGFFFLQQKVWVARVDERGSVPPGVRYPRTVAFWPPASSRYTGPFPSVLRLFLFCTDAPRSHTKVQIPTMTYRFWQLPVSAGETPEIIQIHVFWRENDGKDILLWKVFSMVVSCNCCTASFFPTPRSAAKFSWMLFCHPPLLKCLACSCHIHPSNTLTKQKCS